MPKSGLGRSSRSHNKGDKLDNYRDLSRVQKIFCDMLVTSISVIGGDFITTPKNTSKRPWKIIITIIIIIQTSLGFSDTNGSPNLGKTTRPRNKKEKRLNLPICGFCCPG